MTRRIVFWLLVIAATTAYPEPARDGVPQTRMQTYGLENFLSQPVAEHITESTDIQRVRPGPRRKKHGERGQTYGLENLAPKMYALEGMDQLQENRGPVTFGESDLLAKEQDRVELPRVKLQRRPLEKPASFMVSTTEISQSTPVTAVSNRPRKKVMRRRKKRPNMNLGEEDVAEVTDKPEELEKERTNEPEIIKATESYRKPLRETEEEPELYRKPLRDSEKELESTRKPFRDTETSTEKTTTTTASKEQDRSKKRKRPLGFRKLPESTTEIQVEGYDHNDTEKDFDSQDLINEAKEIDRLEVSETTTEAARERFVPSKEPTGQVSQHDLKALLKQQMGTLSLSEILQTQNLSLADFLKGNRGAISALGKPQPAKVGNDIEERPEQRQDLFKPVPRISVNSRPFSKTSEDSKPYRLTDDYPKTLNVTEVTEDKATYNGFSPKNPRTRPAKEQNEEPSPTLRSFIKKRKEQEVDVEQKKEPSLRSTVTTRKENDNEEEEEEKEVTRWVPTTSTTTTTEEPTTEESQKQRENEGKLVPKRYGDLRQKLRIDRRKWNSSTTSITTERSSSTTNTVSSTITRLPPKPTEDKPAIKQRVRIPFMSANNPQVNVIIQNKTQVPERVDRLNIRDRFKLFNKRVNAGKNDKDEDSNENVIQENHKEPEKTVNENVEIEREVKKNCSAEHEEKHESQDEILELLKSGNNVMKLQRILAERNMTLEELLENREQGAAQAEFHPVHNKTERQEKKVKNNKNELKVFQSFPDFSTDNRIVVNPTQWSKNVQNQDSNSFDELLADESVVNQVRVRPSTERNEHKVYLNLSPTNPNLRTALPGWNVDERSIYSSKPYGYETRPIQTSRTVEVETPKVEETEAILLETIKTGQEANRKLKGSITDILQEQAEVKEDVEAEKTYIPPAVKSAIIASGVVLGIALFVFIAIFAACGWKQRQIRLKARSSILKDTLTRDKKHNRRSMSPISFKQTSLYKKSLDFDETASTGSASSNASSYLWNTLKNTFTSRNSTLKNRLEKEEKEREEQMMRHTLKRDELRRSTISREERINTLQRQEERLFNTLQQERFNSLHRGEDRATFKRIDPDRERSAIKTSGNFKRGGLNASNNFSSCGHLN